MSYDAPAAQQLFTVAVFLGVGFLLGLLFELLRFLRRLFAGEGVSAVRVQDVLFCTLSFFVLFFSLLSFANGKLRLHLLLTSAAGFGAFRFSAGRFVRPLLDRCCKTAQKWGLFLLRPPRALAARIQTAAGTCAGALARRRKKRKSKENKGAKKLRKKRKRGLKNKEKSV